MRIFRLARLRVHAGQRVQNRRVVAFHLRRFRRGGYIGPVHFARIQCKPCHRIQQVCISFSHVDELLNPSARSGIISAG